LFLKLVFIGLELVCGFLSALRFSLSLGYRSTKSSVEEHLSLLRNLCIESRVGNLSKVNCGSYVKDSLGGRCLQRR